MFVDADNVSSKQLAYIRRDLRQSTLQGASNAQLIMGKNTLIDAGLKLIKDEYHFADMLTDQLELKIDLIK